MTSTHTSAPDINIRPYMLKGGGCLDIDRCPDCWERRAHIERYLLACTIFSRIRKVNRILDFGCGVGYGAEMLSSFSNTVVGYDIDRQAIRLAKERHERPNIYFRREMSETPFSGCVALEVIEHLDEPERFVAWVPCKVLVASVPVGSGAGKNPYHKRAFTPESFLTLLRPRFKIVEQWTQTLPHKEKPDIVIVHAVLA